MTEMAEQVNNAPKVTRYWWVNHKQTSRQEIEGGYLWSPKKERSGNRSQFYDNLRLAKPGELVFSYANTEIGHMGCVVGFAFDSAKPADFGAKGAYWDEFGWLLPVDWIPVPNAVRPAEHLEEIAGLLPKKYSPLNAITGFGNQKAYLAEISAELFSSISRTANIETSNLVDLRSMTAIDDRRDRGDEAIEKAIFSETTLSGTEKDALIQARRGQGAFRRNVMHVESKCRITGLGIPNLLIASHIKPWRSCRTGNERLDGYNGLMLAPHVDRLFDLGFISIDGNGDVLISSHIATQTLDQLGLKKCRGQNVGLFVSNQLEYLLYHRSNVFIP